MDVEKLLLTTTPRCEGGTEPRSQQSHHDEPHRFPRAGMTEAPADGRGLMLRKEY